jgi:hypothetical protein
MLFSESIRDIRSMRATGPVSTLFGLRKCERGSRFLNGPIAMISALRDRLAAPHDRHLGREVAVLVKRRKPYAYRNIAIRAAAAATLVVA